MDMSTRYMGLPLKNPLVASASPISRQTDNIRRLEDAGASAVVMYSLFEEQIIHQQTELDYYLERGTEHFAEALNYYPSQEDYHLDPDRYVEHVRRAKEAVEIPVIGSLNGISATGWSRFAREIEQAGADGIELNIYYIPTDEKISGPEIESLYVENLRTVKTSVTIPVAVKLSPFFSATANMAARLDGEGADALVLFNRFYQPDIDLKSLSPVPSIVLSTSSDNRLPMRWVAILHGRVKASLAATGGIHTAHDALKMVLAGADVTMLCATLLKNGIGRLTEIRDAMAAWMDKQGYNSVQQMKGAVSHKTVKNPAAFERANYMKALNEFARTGDQRW
jgi:dihydroorotate dehydrogenase (fumarate)